MSGTQLGGTEQDPVAAIDLVQQDVDRLEQGRGDVLADVVGPDRQFAVAAVDKDGELNRTRPTQVGERVERRPDGATREEHIVDEDNHSPIDAFRRDLCFLEGANSPHAEVIAVHGRVDRSCLDRLALDGLDPTRDTAGESHPAGRDAEEDYLVGAVVSLHDLVGDTREGPSDIGRVQHRTGGGGVADDGS